MSEAVILINATGAILHNNSAASELFALRDGVTVRDQRLLFSDRAAAEMFAGAVANLNGGGGEGPPADSHAFAAHRSDGKRPYLVALRRLPQSDIDTRGSGYRSASLIVIIRDPAAFAEIDTGLLHQSYHLSPAEIDLAVALDHGATVREIAVQRGVAITTVRTQLYALMGKLDVNRQIDLIRLLRQYRLPF